VIRALAIFLTLACFASAAFAQPKITSLSTDWIQRGTTLTVTIAGEKLGSVTGLVFSGEAGLSASLINETAPPPAITVESSSKSIAVVAPATRDAHKTLKASITAAADAALGEREVRAVGPNGVSDPLVLTVGHVPELAEAEPNNTAEQAQKISAPVVVKGVISAATEVDTFRFAAKKGEQLVLEVLAQRKGSPLDSSLAVLDATGKELARSEDVLGFDSVLEFTAPADGDYFAQLRDFQYRGAGDYRYRLFVTTLPYVASVFPFGGQRGQPVEIKLTGANLAGAEKMTLNIDPNAPLGRQEIRLNTPRGLSNPVQFDVRDMPEFTEAEANEGTNANTVAAPVMINGRIGAAKDVDRFTFKAATDGKLVAEVEARRFGSPLDALLAVFSGETLVAQNDDAAGGDARIDFDVKKDATYTVVLRDLTGRGGANFGYRLALRPPTAAAGASLTAKFFPDAVRLHRNGRTRVRVEVARVGFDGPVRVAARDLPPGVSQQPIVIPAGRNEGDLLLTATPDAVMTSQPLRLTATATSGGKELVAIATAIAPEAVERAFKQGFLSVLDTAPFTVDAITVGVNMDQLQSANIDVAVNRAPGFTNDVKLSAVGFVSGREATSKSLNVRELAVKADARTAQLKLTANADSELGVRHLLVRGESTNNGQQVIEFSQPVAVGVAQIPFVLSATPAKISLNAPPAGSTNVDEVELKVAVNRRGFVGDLPLVVKGVPEGVRVEGTNVAANAGELVMKFLATEKAKATTNGSVTIEAAAMVNDRLYRHKTGTIKVVVAPPAVMEVATTNSIAPPK
jgi:uncharacterized protein YdeI (BOF family)